MAEIEAAICELRREHPGWGPRRIAHQLAKTAIDPVPSRDRPMRLWQVDVMRGVDLSDGTELKVVTGIDDRSRFCVGAGLVARATSKTVCQVLTQSLACGIRWHRRRQGDS